MPDIHERLVADHQRLDELFATFVSTVASTDEAAKRAISSDFESALVAHFEAEEKHLFPLLEAEFPEEVLALREEHERIRRQLSELFEAERGPTAMLAQELVTTLRRHARREDSMLYTLVNDPSGSQRYRDLVGYLEETYAKLRDTDYD